MRNDKLIIWKRKAYFRAPREFRPHYDFMNEKSDDWLSALLTTSSSKDYLCIQEEDGNIYIELNKNSDHMDPWIQSRWSVLNLDLDTLS